MDRPETINAIFSDITGIVITQNITILKDNMSMDEVVQATENCIDMLIKCINKTTNDDISKKVVLEKVYRRHGWESISSALDETKQAIDLMNKGLTDEEIADILEVPIDKITNIRDNEWVQRKSEVDRIFKNFEQSD